MSRVLFILIGTQALFSASDFMGRYFMQKDGFTAAAFQQWWFIVYFLIRTLAMFGMLYVFATVPLGKTMALLGASSIVVANVLGLLVLREAMSVHIYIGVVLAIIAFFILAFQ